MRLFAFVLVLAVSSCSLSLATIDCYYDCEYYTYESVQTLFPDEICEASKWWASCIDVLIDGGCHLSYPTALVEASESCNPSQAREEVPGYCTLMDECNFDDELAVAVYSPEICYISEIWAHCLDVFLGACDVIYPLEYFIAQAECYNDNINEDCYYNCYYYTYENVQTLFPDEICEASKWWASCIDTLNEKGCYLSYPEELLEASESCSPADAREEVPGYCTLMDECTFDAQLAVAEYSSEFCAISELWDDCLSDFHGACDIVYPFEFYLAQAECYSEDIHEDTYAGVDLSIYDLGLGYTTG